MSMSKTRFNRCARVSGAVGGSVWALGACVGLTSRFAGAVPESLGVGHLRTLVGVGTIKRRRGALGAKAPRKERLRRSRIRPSVCSDRRSRQIAGRVM